MTYAALATEGREPRKEDCLALYDDQDRRLMQLAAAAKKPATDRVEELMRFISAAGMQRVSIAYCVAMTDEATALERRLQQVAQVAKVHCKVSCLPASALVEGGRGLSCNPLGQALFLAAQDTALNISLGLCLGHDMVFARHSKAPVTTLAVKDRIHGHNPINALK